MEKEQKEIFIKPVTEIIKERISIRNYNPKPLDDNIKKVILSYIETLKGPFDINVRFKLVDLKTAADTNIKLGTYGMIRGASSFLISAVGKCDMNLEELGYVFEKLILYSTSLGLGTCWMGGTFKKSEFLKIMQVGPHEIMPIISPLGYPSDDKTILSSLVRLAAGSKNRKGWKELFFNRSFDNTLNETDGGIYATALEMLRLAPSASNKQPWRIIKDGDNFHFYISHTKGYSKALGFDMQRIDMGIAMCHFELTLSEAGIYGKWQKCEPDIKNSDDNIEYIISWVK